MNTDSALSTERFGFTIFVSACVHVMLIAGIGFSFSSQNPRNPAIEITLAQYQSDQAPEDADFIAQANQLGSGSLDEAVAPSSPFQSDTHDNQIQEAQPVPQPRATAAQQQIDISVLTSLRSPQQLPRETEEVLTDTENQTSEGDTPDDISLAIATLQARLDRQQQAYANRPRRHTISSASTRERHDAAYLEAWRQHIESVGNQHYPEAARQQEIFGSLRMLVGLRPDGSVHEIRILQGSGERILDEAAVNIVQRAAPFAPFPSELQGEVDILEIIRTWRFHRGNSFSSD